MKKIFSILALSAFALSCSKTQKQKTTSKERIINDSVLYYASTVSIPIDIDGDNINDVSIFIKSDHWQTWNRDSTAIIPLVAGVQTPQKTSSVYFSLDSLRCTMSSGDTMVFYSRNTCENSDPKLNRTVLKTFAKVNNNDTIAYSDLTTALLFSYFNYSSSNVPCGQSVSSIDYGNSIGTNSIIQLKVTGKRYDLKVSKKAPYFFVHSVTALD